MHDAADFVAVTQRPKRPAFWSIVNEPTSLPASTLKGSKGPGQEQLVLPRGDHGVIRLVQAWRQLHGAETGSVGDAALDIGVCHREFFSDSSGLKLAAFGTEFKSLLQFPSISVELSQSAFAKCHDPSL